MIRRGNDEWNAHDRGAFFLQTSQKTMKKFDGLVSPDRTRSRWGLQGFKQSVEVFTNFTIRARNVCDRFGVPLEYQDRRTDLAPHPTGRGSIRYPQEQKREDVTRVKKIAHTVLSEKSPRTPTVFFRGDCVKMKSQRH